MNIRDYWPVEIPPISEHLLVDFCHLRQKTFMGFAEREASRGFVNPAVSVRTSHGQEIVRILAMRILEEVGEAYQAEEDDHFFEELIDAFNYLLSMHQYFKIETDEIASYMFYLMQESFGKKYSLNENKRKEFLLRQLGEMTVSLGATLGDQLRNRSWMVHTQNHYFDGNLRHILYPVYYNIFSYFKDFEHFAAYFIAKDAVLQFRLRSNY